MSEHTPEPWGVYGGGYQKVSVGPKAWAEAWASWRAAPRKDKPAQPGPELGHSIATFWAPFGQEDEGQTAEGIARANAERAVACVNACEGINPEAVQELLEACKIALENMLPCNPQWPPFDELDECPAGDEHECGACYNRRLVAAAIEKAQPK